MQSFLISTLLASSAVFSTTYAQVYNYPNVTEIDINIRDKWCESQTSACDLLCKNQELDTSANDCDSETLTYECTCSNGQPPNATEYSQTIPFFICRLEVEGCQEECSGEASCISLCASGKQCGATDPTRVNATTTTSTSKSSATGKSSATQTDSNGFAVTGASDSASDDSSNGASALLEAGSVYGMGVLIAGLAAGLAIVGI